jgi:RNA polymerase sigma-70 factor, ECF subfamily
MSQTQDTTPDEQAFVRNTEPFRRELHAHCYRMLASADEAEDLVQETYLRAWRSYSTFEGRSSMRVWLYRIATNACLTTLQYRARRPLPSGLGAPEEDPQAPVLPAGSEVAWLQPIPDAMVYSDSEDPAAIVAARESVRLALIASLQYLPPRQRAVLILRDVLAWSAAEVAEALDTSTAAVKSTLQRARARLEEVSPAADQVKEPDEPRLRALLDEYMAAFENSDAAALEKALIKDATLEVTSSPTWFSGLRTCMQFLISQKVFGTPGDWLMVPTRANGQSAAAAYRLTPDGGYRGYGIAVLTSSEAGIAGITVFPDPGLLAGFGLPPTRPAGAARDRLESRR